MTELLEHPALPRGVSVEASVYLRPLPCAGDTDQYTYALAGGPHRFRDDELIVRAPDSDTTRAVATVPAMLRWAEAQGGAIADRVNALVESLSAPRAPLLDLALDRPRIMGIVNVTPDSFSDGGAYADAGTAVGHARALAAAGADVIDIGGESTRPGAVPVGPSAELQRVQPVLEGLSGDGLRLSIDTRHAVVMAGALDAGARIVNDVSALRHDPGSMALLAARTAPVILMHAQGDPQTMQREPRYDDVTLDVYDMLAARIEACIDAGIARSRLVIDPGIGFGKTIAHNLALLRQLTVLHGLGCPVLIGVSRKRFIGRLSDDEDPQARLPGSLAAALWAVRQGVQIVRVHDVGETRQALAIWNALVNR